MKTVFGFIGCGNMGGAIAKVVNSCNEEKEVLLSDLSINKATELKNEIGGSVSSNKEISQKADVIFLGVKPQVLKDTISSIRDLIKEREDVLIVSMAAGVQIKKIEEYFASEVAVIRIMPNTPVSVGEGMVLYTCNSKVTKSQLDTFLTFMKLSGKLDEISENYIDAASAISGCGPAFVYMFIEALADGAVSCGLPRDKALLYASQTLVGSATLVQKSDRHPEELKDAVCSPGGSTIVGVKALENGQMRGSVINAVCESFNRTKELGKN
ncbi:MAG: pyrroline-5-carboxylate reductase [Ruminococcaceae bacterium]|nr:pyrroline-5-carboxylate reductase [Oscillospiraceae bacterium]